MSQESSRPLDSVWVLEAPDQPPPRTVRRRVLEHLRRGELVALPTETVYGIAARADDPEALERLRSLKGRDPEAPMTWHVARREALDATPALRPLTRRLAERYWPGPLTLVVEGVPAGLEGVAADGWIGLRLPAHPVARAILEAAEFPVVLTSANRSGSTPLTTGPEVAAAFPSLALVLDAGASRLGESSCVLRLGAGRFELLRGGLLSIEDLRSTAGLRIAFVCTGNTCRSPMAEGLAREILRRRLGAEAPEDVARFGFELSSAGVSAGFGAPAAVHAVEVLAQRGIDISGHLSACPTPQGLKDMDHVYCLTGSHLDRLRELVSRRVSRRFELLDPAGGDIPDPIGGALADYAQCAAAIERALETRAADWA